MEQFQNKKDNSFKTNLYRNRINDIYDAWKKQ